MSDQSSLVSLLGPLPDQQTSLHSLLLSLECQARIVHEKVGQLDTIFYEFVLDSLSLLYQGKASANGSVPCKDPPPDNAELSQQGQLQKKKSMEGGQGIIIAREFLNLSKAVTEALKSTGYLPDINGIVSGNSANFGA